MHETLRQSTTAEPPLQASKWLQIQALLDPSEMEHLFATLGSFFLYACGVVCPEGGGKILKKTFLSHYRNYIETLKTGQQPDLTAFRSLFSPAMTATLDALFAVPVGNNRQIVRVCKPIIQLQAHQMSYSPTDNKFHPMVFGIDSITWGVQFSYPQLYQDSVTKEILAIKNAGTLPNTLLFQTLQKWMRRHTVPTPFLVDGKTINVPMRLGKECFSWINRHPHLIKKGIAV